MMARQCAFKSKRQANDRSSPPKRKPEKRY